ncbi:LPXTG-motif cell wall anchor domain protein [Aeromicrobium marinum DSM 15272]|uniref:LPXTG-motif cell wall anchor domain protein n=1 Tax=Aeromicrobium marinum DSM 15272 TaxID=585531 RepID=E2SDQ6_9ACTN|nr:choice-of-anchor I family protein [Aeromicrobium marinum]EFQ82633.1 LPXTG-motif cell wall anchor domain protein [Aeromicrobium marinum DSM 15272]
MHPSPRRRSRVRSVAAATAVLALLSTATVASAAEPAVELSAPDAAVELDVLGTYRTGQFDVSAAEIVAFHPATDRTFVVNALSGRVDVLDAADPTAPTLVGSIAVDQIGEGAVANSVAIRADGLVVVAVEAPVKTDPGALVFADAATLAVLGSVQVGALPDMVTLTPDGSTAVVANEGEPADDYSIDPEGSVGVVALPDTLAAPSQDAVRTADFHAYEADGDRTLDEDVRVFGPTVNEAFPVSANLEPEYIAIGGDGTTAYAALQEANAVAVVDLASATVTDVWPMGFKDHSVEGNGFDASDRDGGIDISTHPVLGMYMPDGLNSYTAGGTTYLVSANEGDAREWGDYEEPVRVKDLGDDGFAPICEDSPAAGLTGDADLGRLNVSIANGLREDGTCYEQLYSFGARSFSIWTTDGTQVFDSGDALEQITAAAVPEFFNSNHSESNLEGRSDDKGPEPENLTIGTVGDRTYAFIGFERVGGIGVFDITSPGDVQFVTYANNRDFAVSVEDADDPAAVLDSAGDLGPEGLTFVPADDSPTGEALLVVGSEVSGTTTYFGVSDLTEVGDTPLAISLDSATVVAGGTLTGSVSGAEPGEVLTATLFSDPVDLGTLTAGADGVAGLSLVVPASTPAGTHTLQVSGPSGTATAAVVVTAAPGAGSGDGAGPGSGTGAGTPGGSNGLLPDTGTGVALTALAAALALVATGVALVRRRSAA